MHVWTCNIPFPSTEPPTGVAAITDEDTLFAESAGVEGLPDPRILKEAWDCMIKLEELKVIPRFGTRLAIHCKTPDCSPKILARYLYNNNSIACKSPLHQSTMYKFWMDLTCQIATVRFHGCWVNGIDVSDPKVTIFALRFDVIDLLPPKN